MVSSISPAGRASRATCIPKRVFIGHFHIRARLRPARLAGLADVGGLRGDTPISDRARFDDYHIENQPHGSISRSSCVWCSRCSAVPAAELLGWFVESVVDTPAPAQVPTPATPRRRRRRVLLILLAVFLVFTTGGAATVALYIRSIDKSVARIKAFDQVPAQDRPPKVELAGDALNMLVLGSDTRDPDNTDGSRSDTMILVHVPKDRKSAQLVSIPRDTWLRVPKSADGRHGNVNAKINAAFAWGGPALTVQTVEAYTGVRIDHVVMVDFAGFKEIVDALGGVTIDVPAAFTSTHSLGATPIRHFNQGPQRMDGATALDYARERYAFSDGDFTRIQHQHQVISGVLSKASSSGTLTSPSRLNAFLKATAKSVTVDDTLDIFGMATQLRDLRGADLTFITSPSAGTGTEDRQSVVYPDRAKAKLLFTAIRDDDVPQILELSGK
jgi:LCP family protein required for cell wall assembly